MDNLDSVILKTLITNKNKALEFAYEIDLNKQNVFSSENWTFANIIVTHLKTYKDIPTLRILIEKLKTRKNPDKLIENVKNTWEELEKIEYNDKEYSHDLEKIKKRFAEQQIIAAQENIAEMIKDNVDVQKAIFEMQKTIVNINSLNQNKTFENKNVKEYLSSFVENFNLKKNNPNIEVGLKTYYSFLDFATNGLKPADFVIVAAESGFGKSLFLNNIAIQTWLQADSIENAKPTNGKNIIYFSLEMPYEDCFIRFISRLSGVNSRDIENADLSKAESTRVRQVLDFIKNFPFEFNIVDISDACANNLDVILTNLNRNYDAIFIDYLGIMKTNDKTDDQDWLAQGKVSYEVRAIARKYKVPIFSAVQLNRKTESKTKDSSSDIGLNRLARSSTIATHATHILQIASSSDNSSEMVVHIIKNRKGPKIKGSLIKNLAAGQLIDSEPLQEAQESEEVFTNYNVDDISEAIEDLEL